MTGPARSNPPRRPFNSRRGPVFDEVVVDLGSAPTVGSVAVPAVSRLPAHESEGLRAVGVSHHHAPLEVRERLFLADGHALELATALAGDGVEAVVLSTCNRTEIYLAGGSEKRAREELERRSGLELGEVLASWEDEAAVEHLFRVSAGLDSLVPGEAQILGQVRQAYDAALTAGSTGPLLNRLFEDALRAGKRVRTEASLAELPESVVA